VVGFSRVKDERKGVFHCRRIASAGGDTDINESLDNGWTTTGKEVDSCWTDTGQTLCDRPVEEQ
jgi:hypothetical protein